MPHSTSKKTLRSGYTTGTCAAAAAKAAAFFCLTAAAPQTVSLLLPAGAPAVFHPIPCSEPDYINYFKVQKDAGDDPDVTNGSWIYAKTDLITEPELERLKETAPGYWLEDYPHLYLMGGEGIGLVTKPGLSCPPGHYAINPIPRRMILEAVDQVCEQLEYENCLCVRIAIPEGTALGEKTFNPRLGIEGGISILGTTGIVKPMSEEALLETIRLDIHMKATAGEKILLLAPGNYGENFLRERMRVPLGEAVLCSNFVADAVEALVSEGIGRLLFVGHIGKLIKVSAGIKNTHSRYGDGRMGQMAALTACAAPGNPELVQAVRLCNTTEEAVGLLQKAGLAEPVLKLAAERVKAQLEDWSGGRLKVQVVTFSAAYGILGETEYAKDMLDRWRQQREDRHETGGNQLYEGGKPGLRETGETVPGAGHSL